MISLIGLCIRIAKLTVKICLHLGIFKNSNEFIITIIKENIKPRSVIRYINVLISSKQFGVAKVDIVPENVSLLFVVYLRNKFHVGYFILAVLALKSHFNLCESIAYRETIWAFGGMYLQRAVPKDIEIVISYDRVE